MRLGRLSYVLGRYREAARHLEAPLASLRALRERRGAPVYEHFLEALRPVMEKFRTGSGAELPREELADMTEGGAQRYFGMAESYGVPRPPVTPLPELRREEEAWLDRTLADRTATVRQIVDLLAARNGDLFAQGRLPVTMTAWFTEQAARLNARLGKRLGNEPPLTAENIEEASLAAMKERIGRTSWDKAIGRQTQIAALEMDAGARKARMGTKPAADPDDPDLARFQRIVWAEMAQEEAERPAAPLPLSTLADWLEDLTRRTFPYFQEEAQKNIGQEDADVVAALSCEAELHNFLGRLLALDGSADQAAEQLRQAWDIVEATDLRALQLWIPRSDGVSATSTGYDIVGEHGAARTLGLPPAPTLGKACGNQSDGSLDLWWGDFLAAAKRDGEALQRYRRAAAKGVDQSRPLALGGIAAVYQRQGKRQEALDTYLLAIDAVESILGQIRLDQLVSSFAGRQAPLYARAIDLATELAQPDLAFELAERARARAFLNQIGNRRIDLHGVPPDLIAEWQAARERLEDAQARRRSGSPSVENVRTEDRARQAYEEMLERLKRASPEYASLVAVEVAGREEVQQLLPQETTLVDYFVLDRRTLAWVIDKDEAHLVELPIAAEDLQNQVKTFRLLVANRGADETDETVARELYAALIAPLEPFLRHRSLVLVPHGPLHYLPFAALRDAAGRFLIEDHTLALVPSASALRFAGRGRPAPGALVLGDPDGTLPQADQEAEAIAALYGTRAYRGPAATEALVQKQAGRTGILHLAAHGSYDPVRPLFSHLALSPGDGQDGRLEVHEIYRLDLSATRLVALSACETALGERSDGDDVVGLSRALLATGAPAVVTTLWKIDDRATGTLMTALHRRLRQGDSAAAALQAAQLEVLAQPEWRSPFFWSAFTLTGVEGVPQGKPGPRPRSLASPKPPPPPPAPAPDPESDLVAAMFRAKERAHKSCRPVPAEMARALPRFFALVSETCWVVDTDGAILQGLSYRDGDLPVVAIDDTLIFRTEEDSRNPALWSHALVHNHLYQRVGISGFVRIYLKSPDDIEKTVRTMEKTLGNSSSRAAGFDPGYTISGRNVVFSYDPAAYHFGGTVSSVVVAGSFNGWTTDASRWRASDDDHDGRWTLTAYRGDVTCGSQFKFIVNGTAWQQPSRSWPPDHRVDDGHGGFNLLVVCR